MFFPDEVLLHDNSPEAPSNHIIPNTMILSNSVPRMLQPNLILQPSMGNIFQQQTECTLAYSSNCISSFLPFIPFAILRPKLMIKLNIENNWKQIGQTMEMTEGNAEMGNCKVEYRRESWRWRWHLHFGGKWVKCCQGHQVAHLPLSSHVNVYFVNLLWT